MKYFQLNTAHFDGEVDENTLRESGDFCDPEVEEILQLNVGEKKRYDNGITLIERIN
jgi:hypothetical protein